MQIPRVCGKISGCNMEYHAGTQARCKGTRSKGSMKMTKLEQIYEGKAKKVFRTDDPAYCVVEYKDDATAFNGLKKGTILGKGAVNNRMTNLLMQMLEQQGIPHARYSSCATPRPSREISPPVGCKMPQSIRIRVVFPAPLAPKSP